MALVPEWTLGLGKPHGRVIHGRCVNSKGDVKSTTDPGLALVPEDDTLDTESRA